MIIASEWMNWLNFEASRDLEAELVVVERANFRIPENPNIVEAAPDPSFRPFS